jgi:hypothetical protein
LLKSQPFRLKNWQISARVVEFQLQNLKTVPKIARKGGKKGWEWVLLSPSFKKTFKTFNFLLILHIDIGQSCGG